MIELKNVEKVYQATSVETSAIRDMNLKIRAGEFVAVMGPSGSGKSSFLNIVGMLDRATSGEYWFDGHNVSHRSENELSNIRKGSIGFVFQSFNLIEELTVLENVELALLYHPDVAVEDRRKRAKTTLDRLRVGHRAHHFPSQLSGGQQQRVAIARAVVARPKLILADEPTGNLDTTNGEEVMQLLTQLNDEGITIVMVTHSPSHAEYAHRIVNLLDGAIVTETIRKIF